MRYLSLDLGRKHTGVAFFDDRTGVPVPLETIHHEDDEELVECVSILASERSIDAFVIGLPFLPGGQEGEQVRFVRDIAKKLCEACPWAELHFIDERYSGGDDAKAALEVLKVFLDREKKSK